MKTHVKITILLVVAALILFAVQAMQRISEPESTILAHEREAIYMARDKGRMEKDPAYAAEMRDRLQSLDLRTAAAYIAENDPDAAIAVVQALIADEEAHAKSAVGGRSRSYGKEMLYQKTLKNAYELKKDAAGAKKAVEAYDAFLLKAASARARESREEGKHVGAARD